jgi:mono/diheme cytochrome c family protein
MRMLITTAAVLALSLNGFGAEPTNTIKKVEAKYTSPASGAEMFRSYCAACHGQDAKGTGLAASALKKAPPDLTILSRKNNGKFPALVVQQTIRGDTVTAAHGSRDMPVWGDIFGGVSAGPQIVELRVYNLTSYIDGLQAK